MIGEEIYLSNNYYFLLSLLQVFKMSQMNVRVNYQTKHIYGKMMKSLIFFKIPNSPRLVQHSSDRSVECICKEDKKERKKKEEKKERKEE